jgi:AraC family transcriptional regulator, regulatory protein of adaptative response / DNA-3-methyladenine glycosylase II
VAALGEPLEQPQGTLTHYFPLPETVAQADMQGLGLTPGRIAAVQGLAHAVAEHGLVLNRDADWQHTVTQLQCVPGIGPWTASYIAMRALGDPDAFPAADLGLRHACEWRGMTPIDARSIERRAEAWRPWRAYAAHHLWASLPAIPPTKRARRQLVSAAHVVSLASSA